MRCLTSDYLLRGKIIPIYRYACKCCNKTDDYLVGKIGAFPEKCSGCDNSNNFERVYAGAGFSVITCKERIAPNGERFITLVNDTLESILTMTLEASSDRFTRLVDKLRNKTVMHEIKPGDVLGGLSVSDIFDIHSLGSNTNRGDVEMNNKVRTKFLCTETSTIIGWSEHPFTHTAKFQVVTCGNVKNNEFFAATPSGNLTLGVLSGQFFEPGKSYYVDITLADK